MAQSYKDTELIDWLSPGLRGQTILHMCERSLHTHHLLPCTQ